ncbi:LptA/OstA family protein [Sagittula sp. SSi028]|uniref:LptA/OstA family protein n=1 Tax=Sagittula sp. SSi028 TaxID=3400636 RepID=UPI003AF68C8B
MTNAFAASTLALITMFAPMCAAAQGTQVNFGGFQQDTDAPVEVTADALSVDQTDGTALYQGNVIIIQGEMRLAAPRVLVVYAESAGRIERMEATGGVLLVSGTEAAEAERADYHIDSGTVDMAGNVLVTQGANAMTSEFMTVYLDSGTAEMSGRVKTVLQSSDGDASGDP